MRTGSYFYKAFWIITTLAWASCKSEPVQESFQQTSVTPVVTSEEIVSISVTPTPTPDPRPLSNFPQFDYPDWLRDHTTTVIALSMSNQDGYLPSMFTIVNAETGERVDIPPFLAGSYFWSEDGRYLGFTSWTGEVLLLNLAEGGVVSSHIDEEVLSGTLMSVDKTLWGFALSGWISTGVISENATFGIIDDLMGTINIDHDPDIILSHFDWKQSYPMAHLSVSLDDTMLIVENLLTRARNDLSQVQGNETIVDIYYSPSGDQAAVIIGVETEGTRNHPDACLRYAIYEGYRMQVFDLNIRKQLGPSWEVACAEWSPDGEKLSFIVKGERGADELCIFFPDRNHLLCTSSMFNKSDPGYYLDGHLSYHWSPDSEFIMIRVDCFCIGREPGVPITSTYLGLINVSDGSFREIGFSGVWDLGLWRPAK